MRKKDAAHRRLARSKTAQTTTTNATQYREYGIPYSWLLSPTLEGFESQQAPSILAARSAQRGCDRCAGCRGVWMAPNNWPCTKQTTLYWTVGRGQPWTAVPSPGMTVSPTACFSFPGLGMHTTLGLASQRETPIASRTSKSPDAQNKSLPSSLGSLVPARLVRRTVRALLAPRIALLLDRRLIARGPSTPSKKKVCFDFSILKPRS